MADFDTQINVGMNVDGVVSGTEKAKRSVRDLGESARGAGKSLAGIGDGSAQSAQRVEAATRSMVGSLQRQIAATEAGDKSTRAYQESLARLRGVDLAVLKPYLDQLDAAKAKTDLAAKANDGLGGSFGSLGSRSVLAANAVALVGAALSAAFSAASIKGVIDVADSFSKLSQKSGVAVDALRGLNYAASLSDVSTESLGTGLRKLSQNMAAAAGGGKEQAAAFAAVGVSIRGVDGSLKGADKVLAEVAGKFANFKDGPEKAALAIELFGKQGADLIPLLNSGTSGLSEMSKEAAQLGIVFGDGLAKNAEAFNDNLTRIQASAEGAKIAIANELLPTLNTLAQAFVDAQKASTGFGGFIGGALKTIIEAATILYANVDFVLQGIRREFGAIGAQFAALGRLDFKGFNVISEAVKEDGKRARAELDKFQYDLLNAGILTSKAGAGRGTAPDPRSLGDTQTTAPVVAKAVAGANKELKEQAERIKIGRELAQQLGDDVVKANQEYQKALADATKERDKYIDGLNKSADAIANQVLKLGDEEKALRISQDQNISLAQAITQVEIARLREAQSIELSYGNDTAAEAIGREIALRKELAVAIDSKASREAAAKSAAEATSEWKKAADKIENSITDALMRGFENGKDFAENLRDTVVNMFKTMVLRPIVSAIVSPVAGAITGALGFSGAANAASAVNNGSAVINGASMLNTLGGFFTDFKLASTNAVYEFGGALTKIGAEKLGSMVTANATSIGTFANYAGYALNAISALDAASRGEWGKAIGTGLGAAFFGPLGGAVGGALGGLVDSAFGGGSEYTTGTGIKGKFAQGGFTGSNYQEWRNDGSSGLFGIGGSGSSSGINLSALNQATADGLSQGFLALQIASAGMAASLGLDAKKIAGYSQDIKVALGADAEANKKAIEDLFSGVANSLATTIAPQIAQFSNSGESASATLSRLSTSIVTANSWLGLLRQRLFQVSLSGADAASKLADAFGGLDKLTASSQAFYESYYTNSEKVTANQNAMTASLAALGLALPTTKDQFKALALSLDLNTDSGRTAYATLLQLAPQFAATADLAAQAAKDTAKALLGAFTGNGQLIPALNAATLSLTGVQAGADVVVGGMTQIRSAMLDVNSPIITFTGTVGTLSTGLTGAQRSSLLLQDQIEALSGASSKATIDFAGLTNALQGSSSAVFIEVIGLIFENLAERISGVVESITTERVALREAAIQIINPTALSKSEIQRGISGIGTSLPSNAGVVAANAALAAADASVAAKQNSLDSAKASIDAVGAASAALDSSTALYKAQAGEFLALQTKYGVFANATGGSGFNRDALAYNASTNRVNGYEQITYYQGQEANVGAFKAAQGPLADSLGGANAVLANAEQALASARANAVADLAPYTAAVTAATAAQKTAEAGAAKALLDYQKALQNFALDAGKSVAKLSNLRQETVKYYEAQKALADLMQTSAANLLGTVASYRFQQLSPEAQSASLQSQFSVAYAAALSSQKDGNTLAQYADKLNSTLGPLIESLNATGQDYLINSYLAQAESIAKLLQDNAPQNYQADSLALLGDIDATLAALEASSKSAEQVISDAIAAGSDRTAAGLGAVIAAITGKTIPAFASGGAYGGGLALVGEQGPELIDFNQSGQVYNASQTAGMFGNGGAVVAELQAVRAELANLRAETRSTAISSSKTAKILERVTPDGVSLQTVAA